MGLNIKIENNVSLADLTTLKIGGKARLFVRAESEEQIAETVDFCAENDIPLFVLGGGSNVLIADEGFDGLVLQIGLKGIEIKDNLITAQAGEDWDKFVEFCVSKNLAGIECLSGIPGFVGAVPVQNVGAYGQEVSETIVKVRTFDRKTREFLELSNADCKFGYRTSIFNTTEKNRFIVLAVTFNLIPKGKPKIVYQDLREFFAGKRPNLQRTREAVLQIRRAKSMVIDEADKNSRSVGSFFKNPIVENHKLAEIIDLQGFDNVPHFKVDERNIKIPAAWLIENAGFQKGYKKKRAGLSANHVLALINRGNASANEILDLKDEIQQKVKAIFGIDLVPEPVFVGFDKN